MKKGGKAAVLCFPLLLALDFASKAWVVQNIPPLLPKIFGYPYGGIGVFNLSGVTFSLNTIGNTGAAWSLFQNYPGTLFILRLLIIGSLIIYLSFFHVRDATQFPLWLIVTGAIGNAIDYGVYGHVVDFLHFCFWGKSFPIFNFADSYISIGVCLLLWMSRRKKG